MWSARKIMTRASADTPWATRSGAGTAAWRDHSPARRCRSAAARASAITQHATQSQVSGTGSCSMLRTTPTKVNKVGAATASRAMRFARNCATVGTAISERDIAASIAISGIAKARARHTAALNHEKAAAPVAAMRVTLALKPLRAKG